MFIHNHVLVGNNIRGIKKVVVRVSGDDEPSMTQVSELKGNSRKAKYESEVLDIFIR